MAKKEMTHDEMMELFDSLSYSEKARLRALLNRFSIEESVKDYLDEATDISYTDDDVYEITEMAYDRYMYPDPDPLADCVDEYFSEKEA